MVRNKCEVTRIAEQRKKRQRGTRNRKDLKFRRLGQLKSDSAIGSVAGERSGEGGDPPRVYGREKD